MKTKQKTTQTQNPKNNLIKTPILTTLLLTIFTLFTFNDNAHANMFNKFKKGFYFENQSKSSIISYLEQNYPVGSSVKELIVEMKKAGAKVEYFSSKDSYSFCLEEVHSSTLCEDSKYANYIIRYLIDENNMGFWQKIRGIKKQLIRIAIKVEEGNDKIITHKKHTGDYVEYTKHTNDTGLFMKKMDKSGLSPRKAKEYAAYSDKVTLTRKKDMFFSVAFINIYNEFKFQKYDNGDYAKDALLIMHPIGSDVGELVKRLEGAGGKCGIIAKDLVREKTEQNTYLVSVKVLDKILDPKDYHQCNYVEYTLPFGFGEYSWTVTVYVEGANYKTIKEMIVFSELFRI